MPLHTAAGARASWLVAIATLLALPPSVRAQAGLHPLPPGPRHLAERLADADVVVLARVREIRADRVAVEAVTALRGRPGSIFEIKRAPSWAQPPSPGRRAFWMLRGARSPYVPVDGGGGVIELSRGSDDPAWIAALRRLEAAGGDREAIRDVYLAWIDGTLPELREAAVAAFQRRGGSLPIPAATSEQRARIALDPRRTAPVRRASAAIASRRGEGLERLVAGLPGEGDAADPVVIATAFREPSLPRTTGAEGALLRCLRHPQPRVRLAGLGATRTVWSQTIGAQVARLARDDGDPDVRSVAASALAAHAGSGSRSH